MTQENNQEKTYTFMETFDRDGSYEAVDDYMIRHVIDGRAARLLYGTHAASLITKARFSLLYKEVEGGFK